MQKIILVALAALLVLSGAAYYWVLRPRTILSSLEGLSLEEQLQQIRTFTPQQHAQFARESDARREQQLAQAGHRWSGSITVSSMDDSVEARYENPATAPIGLEQVRPELLVRCDKNETRLAVNTKLGKASEESEQPLRLRFDDAAPISTKWWTSTNGVEQRVLVPDDSAALLKQLFAANTLLVEFQSDTGGQHLATFDVRGLRKAILADLKRNNDVRRAMAEYEKKPVPVTLTPPCAWVEATALP